MRVFSAEIVHDILYQVAELSDTFVSSLERENRFSSPLYFLVHQILSSILKLYKKQC